MHLDETESSRTKAGEHVDNTMNKKKMTYTDSQNPLGIPDQSRNPTKTRHSLRYTNPRIASCRNVLRCLLAHGSILEHRLQRSRAFLPTVSLGFPTSLEAGITAASRQGLDTRQQNASPTHPPTKPIGRGEGKRNEAHAKTTITPTERTRTSYPDLTYAPPRTKKTPPGLRGDPSRPPPGAA